MDALWLVIVLTSWYVLTERYFRDHIITADPKVWAWLGRRFPPRALLAIYRATFFYGLVRLVAWTSWAHVIHPDPMRGWDLTWGGPYWIPSFSLTTTTPAVALVVSAVFAGVVLMIVARILRPSADDAEATLTD